MLAALFINLALVLGSFPHGNFLLQQGLNTIEGRVTNAEGRPVSDIRVFLQNDVYSPVGTAYTDGSGRYRFNGIPAGSYNVQIEPAGTDYERQSQRVDAISFIRRGARGSSEVFRADFVLRPRRVSMESSDPKVVFVQDIPATAKKEFQSALKSFETNGFETAAPSLKHAIEIFPDYYDALELLGTEYVKRHEYQLAMPLLERAVAVNKNSWRGFYSLGIAQVESSRREEGVKSLRRAAELNATSANVYMWLGIGLAQSDATRADAIQALKKATQLAKDTIPRAHFYLAALYIKNNQYREAADSLEAFLHTSPDTPERDKIKAKIKELRQKATTETTKN